MAADNAGLTSAGAGGSRPPHERVPLPLERAILWTPRVSATGEGAPQAPDAYPLFLERDVIADVMRHLSEGDKETRFGFLLGRLYLSPASGVGYAVADAAVAVEETLEEEASGASLIRAWSDARDRFSEHSGLLLGWYHSHFKLGLMPSDADLDTATRYFDAPWQFSVIVVPDRARPLGGVFRPPSPAAAHLGARPAAFYEILNAPHGGNVGGADSAVAWSNYEAHPSGPSAASSPGPPARSRPAKSARSRPARPRSAPKAPPPQASPPQVPPPQTPPVRTASGAAPPAASPPAADAEAPDAAVEESVEADAAEADAAETDATETDATEAEAAETEAAEAEEKLTAGPPAAAGQTPAPDPAPRTGPDAPAPGEPPGQSVPAWRRIDRRTHPRVTLWEIDEPDRGPAELPAPGPPDHRAGIPLVIPGEGGQAGLLPPRSKRIAWPVVIAGVLVLGAVLFFLLPDGPSRPSRAIDESSGSLPQTTTEIRRFESDVEALSLAAERYEERATDFDAGRISCDLLTPGYVAADDAYFAVAASYQNLGRQSNSRAVAAYEGAGEDMAAVNSHFDQSGCPRP